MNNKERLFDLFQKVNKININENYVKSSVLNESTLKTDNKHKIINNFIKFVDDNIQLNKNLPKIVIIDKEGHAKKNKSFGGYLPSNYSIEVVIKNRNLADVLRTLAHELVHHKQNIENRLNPNSGQTGSDEENEANALAGKLMRDFGKINPDIFE